MTATSGPTPDQALLVAACFKRSDIGPSRCRQVEPQQAVMVGPNGAVLASHAFWGVGVVVWATVV